MDISLFTAKYILRRCPLKFWDCTNIKFWSLDFSNIYPLVALWAFPIEVSGILSPVSPWDWRGSEQSRNLDGDVLEIVVVKWVLCGLGWGRSKAPWIYKGYGFEFSSFYPLALGVWAILLFLSDFYLPFWKILIYQVYKHCNILERITWE